MAVAVTTTWQRLCSVSTQERFEKVEELNYQLNQAYELFRSGSRLVTIRDILLIEDTLNEAIEELNNS